MHHAFDLIANESRSHFTPQFRQVLGLLHICTYISQNKKVVLLKPYSSLKGVDADDAGDENCILSQWVVIFNQQAKKDYHGLITA